MPETDLITQLIALLQSGSDVGIVLIVWFAVKLKKAVTEYLTGVNDTLSVLSRCVRDHEERLRKLEADRNEHKHPATVSAPVTY